MAESLKLSREEIIICYKEDVERLLKFLPWLEKKSGSAASSVYSGEGIEKSSMPVPVYDSTLLSFIKEIRTTDFLNRNYVYTFSRYRIKTASDELRVIDATEGRSIVRGCGKRSVFGAAVEIKGLDGNQKSARVKSKNRRTWRGAWLQTWETSHYGKKIKFWRLQEKCFSNADIGQ